MGYYIIKTKDGQQFGDKNCTDLEISGYSDYVKLFSLTEVVSLIRKKTWFKSYEESTMKKDKHLCFAIPKADVASIEYIDEEEIKVEG
jgi:hypothetical protein